MVLSGGFHLVVGLQYAEESLGIDEGVVHVVVDAVQLADWSADVSEKHHVVHDFSDGHSRVVNQDEIGRQNDDEHRSNLLEETLQAVEKVGLLARVQLQIGHFLLQSCLLVGFGLLAIERFYDVHALDDAQNALADGLMTSENTSSSAFHSRGLNVGHPEVERHDAKSHETHINVGDKHEAEGENSAREEGQNLDEEVVYCVAHAHDASVDSRLQFARLVAFAIEERHSEREDAVHHLQRHVARDQNAHPLAIVSLAESNDGADDFLAQKDDGNDGQKLDSLAPMKTLGLLHHGIDGIYRTVQHHSIYLRHQRADERQDECHNNQPFIGQNKGQNVT